MEEETHSMNLAKKQSAEKYFSFKFIGTIYFFYINFVCEMF